MTSHSKTPLPSWVLGYDPLMGVYCTFLLLPSFLAAASLWSLIRFWPLSPQGLLGGLKWATLYSTCGTLFALVTLLFPRRDGRSHRHLFTIVASCIAAINVVLMVVLFAGPLRRNGLQRFMVIPNDVPSRTAGPGGEARPDDAAAPRASPQGKSR